MTTNTKAAVVYVTSSLRVGQITFRSSAATCRVNSAGVVRSRLAAAPDPLRSRVWVAMSSPNTELNGSPRTGRRDPRVQPIRTCRAGGTRTPTRRFWRPGLYQLSYCPPVCNHQSVRRTHHLRRTEAFTRPGRRNQLQGIKRKVTPYMHANHENIGPRVGHLRIRDPGRRCES